MTNVWSTMTQGSFVGVSAGIEGRANVNIGGKGSAIYSEAIGKE